MPNVRAVSAKFPLQWSIVFSICIFSTSSKVSLLPSASVIIPCTLSFSSAAFSDIIEIERDLTGTAAVSVAERGAINVQDDGTCAHGYVLAGQHDDTEFSLDCNRSAAVVLEIGVDSAVCLVLGLKGSIAHADKLVGLYHQFPDSYILAGNECDSSGADNVAGVECITIKSIICHCLPP